MQSGRNVIIESTVPGTGIGLEKIDWVLADAFFVVKNRHFWAVMDIEFALEVRKSVHGVKIGREDSGLSVRVETKDIIGRFVTRVRHVHWVLPDKDPPIGGNTNG